MILLIVDDSILLFGEGNGTPLQYSCLGNPMGRGPWQAAVHEVANSWTQLSDFPFSFPFHALEKEMTTHSMFLPGESQGRGSLVGCHLWGRTESDMTGVMQQQQRRSKPSSIFRLETVLQLGGRCPTKLSASISPETRRQGAIFLDDYSSKGWLPRP